MSSRVNRKESRGRAASSPRAGPPLFTTPLGTKSGLRRRGSERDGGGTERFAGNPCFIKSAQVHRRTDQRPLGAHRFQTFDRPATEAVVLFDLRKAAFDDAAALRPLPGGQRLFEPRSHLLHDGGVRSHFDLPAFGVLRALASHRAVPAMAAVPLDAQAGFHRVAFPVQNLAPWTGYAFF